MRVWSVANQKGGVGKTTTSINLAGLLADAGRSTLLIDLDPHGSSTAYFGYDPDAVTRSVYQLFQANAPHPATLIRDTVIPKLKLLPASSALATLDRQLGAQEGKGLAIRHALDKLEDSFSYVLIDCPPVLGVLMVNALAACERLIVPVQTEFLALKGLERMVRTLQMIQQSRGSPLPFVIVPTMFDRRTNAAHESLRHLKETYPYNMWNNVVPIDTQLRDASRVGMPLTIANPKARGAIAYRQLLGDLLRVSVNPVVSAAVAE